MKQANQTKANQYLRATHAPHTKGKGKHQITTIALMLGGAVSIVIINLAIVEINEKKQFQELDKKIQVLAQKVDTNLTERAVLEPLLQQEFRKNPTWKSITIKSVDNAFTPIEIKREDTQSTNRPIKTYSLSHPIVGNQKNRGIITVQASTKSHDRSTLTKQIASTLAISLAVLMISTQIRKKCLAKEKALSTSQQQGEFGMPRSTDNMRANFGLALEASSDGWWEWDRTGNKAYISEKLRKLMAMEMKIQTTDSSLYELSEYWWQDFFKANQRAEAFLTMKETSRKSIEVEFTPNKSKKSKFVRINRYAISHYDSDKEGIIFTLEDISEKVIKRHKIEAIAYTDNLTRLANRASFELELEKLFAENQRKDYRYSLFMIDIDYFKHLNDTHGHVVGDKFLREISVRLRGILRPTDFIARIGGDEFVVITRFPYADNQDIQMRSLSIAEKIRSAIAKPFEVKGLLLMYNCSIGICIDSEQSREAMSLLDYADIALYDAKEKGRNRASFFNQSMKDLAIRTASLKESIDHILANNLVYLKYQPIYDISLKRKGVKKYILCGHEALFRCDEIEANTQLIIETAETTGQIEKVTAAVINVIGNDIKKGNLSINEKQRISINVSALELLNPSFPEQFLSHLDRNAIQANHVYIEVTETAFISNVEIAKENILNLRRKGVKFAMDDFGTGYASIQILKHIKMDRIKIDQSYIKEATDDIGLSMIKTVIWMARALDVELVAEGIEEEEQLGTLSSIGCTLGQGFYLDRMLADSADKQTR